MFQRSKAPAAIANGHRRVEWPSGCNDAVRMPVAQTRRFGALEYDPFNVLQFPAGLPGFDGQKQFMVVEKPEWTPIVFLQSLNTPELCFMAAPVEAVHPGYALDLTREDLERLGLDPSQPPPHDAGLLPLALLSAPEHGPLTANLLAPVVINWRARRAVQSVRADRRYSHQHPVGAQSPEAKGAC